MAKVDAEKVIKIVVGVAAVVGSLLQAKDKVKEVANEIQNSGK